MAEGRRYTPHYVASLETWLDHLDRSGLSHGVLIQPSFLGYDNGLIAEALTEHRERLRGVAVVPTDVAEGEIARLKAQGFMGARLNLVGETPEDYRAPQWQRFFKMLAEAGWQVEIQRAVDDLALIAEPILATGVTVMIDHFGLPKGGLKPELSSHQAFLDLLRREPALWVKLSAAYRSGMDDAQAMQTFQHLRSACGGVERFVWGSDWPHTNHENETDYVSEKARLERLIPDLQERQQVLVAGPAKLFHFKT